MQLEILGNADTVTYQNGAAVIKTPHAHSSIYTWMGDGRIDLRSFKNFVSLNVFY